MESAKFGVVFDGPGLRSKTMAVEDLAPALMAACDLVRDTDRILNKRHSESKLRISANLQGGSFELILELVQLLTDLGKNLGSINLDPVKILESIGFAASAGLNLLGMFKKFGMGKIWSAKKLKDGTTELTIKKNDKPIIIDTGLYKLYVNKSIRKSMVKFVSSVESKEIDKITILRNDVVVGVISADDLQSFEMFKKGKSTSTKTDYFQLATAPATESRRWRFIDYKNVFSQRKRTITAAMEDREYNEKWKDREELVGFGDVFELEIKEMTVSTRTSVRRSYKIVKVVDHIPGDRQLELELNGD